MSFVIAAPEMVASAASELADLRSSVSAASEASAAPTTSVAAAAADEVWAWPTLVGRHSDRSI
jgi:PE family